MSESFGLERKSATEIECKRFPRSEKNFHSGKKWARHARLAWPRKTAAVLAAVAKSTERQAKNWLAGHQQPPATVLAALFAEIASDLE
jgi:hypothetical protein